MLIRAVLLILQYMAVQLIDGTSIIVRMDAFNRVVSRWTGWITCKGGLDDKKEQHQSDLVLGDSYL